MRKKTHIWLKFKEIVIAVLLHSKKICSNNVIFVIIQNLHYSVHLRCGKTAINGFTFAHWRAFFNVFVDKSP